MTSKKIMTLLAFLVAALVMAHANPAAAQYLDMGNCTADETVPAERIDVACTNFINDRMVENWRTEYIGNALYYRGLARQRLGRDAEAEKDLREVMHYYPSFADAWVHYGEIAEKRGEAGQFEKVMDLMIAANSTNPDVLNIACWERAKRGEQLDAALADCNESLRLKPNAANVLDSRGFLYFRLGKFANSIADNTAALTVNPKLASSLYVRGLAKKAAGDSAGGDADISAANALDAKIADTYAGYGVKP